MMQRAETHLNAQAQQERFYLALKLNAVHVVAGNRQHPERTAAPHPMHAQQPRYHHR
jgi:hypothetical protein